MRWPPFRIAFVLGGGGARGLAHIGVLEVLGAAGIRPDVIVGTSSGAIVGGAYALRPDASALYARFAAVLGAEGLRNVEKKLGVLADNGGESPGVLHGLLDGVRRLVLWNRQALQQSLVDGVLIADLIQALVGGASFADVEIPFHAVAYDLNANADVILSEGELAAAIHASSAVPGVFAPVALGGRLLVDGAVFQELPTGAARGLAADFLLAVDVGSAPDERPPASAAEVMWRVLELRGDRLRRESGAAADFVIRPGVSDVRWSQFSRAQACIDAGVQSARADLDALQAALRRARVRSLPRRWLRRLSRAAAAGPATS